MESATTLEAVTKAAVVEGVKRLLGYGDAEAALKLANTELSLREYSAPSAAGKIYAGCRVVKLQVRSTGNVYACFQLPGEVSLGIYLCDSLEHVFGYLPRAEPPKAPATAAEVTGDARAVVRDRRPGRVAGCPRPFLIVPSRRSYYHR